MQELPMSDTPMNVVIDLSHNNANVNFAAAKNDGVVGVFHKATEGMTFTDPAYAGRKQRALDSGLLWGAYHFGTAVGDGASQAQRFLDVVQPDPQTLIVLDFEENKGNTMTLDQARQFVTTIHDRLQRFPGLYGGSFLKEVLRGGTDPVLANCWLWWAEYGSTPSIPPNWKQYTLWQYTDGVHGDAPHQVQGIGACDRDKFNGDMNALLQLWGKMTTTGVADTLAAATGT
jgi:lysozyme